MSLNDILKEISGESLESPQGCIEKSNSLSNEILTYLGSITSKSGYRSPGFHASSLYSLCERKLALQKFLDVEDATYIGPALRLKFLVGEYVHSYVQNELLGPAKKIVGKWQCKTCSNPFSSVYNEFVYYPDFKCQLCKNDVWTYIEPKFSISVPEVPDEDAWNIVGSCDGLMEDAVVDFKTVSPYSVKYLEKNWNKLENIKDFSYSDENLNWGDMSVRKYYTQLQLYLEGFNKDKGYIYYIPKDALDNPSKWIQFILYKDDSVIDQMFRKVQRIYDQYKSIEEGNRPFLGKNICKTQLCPTAKDCSVSRECFGWVNKE